MNFAGQSLTLHDASGHVVDSGCRASSIGVVLKSALTGSLTIVGIVDSAGSPVSWVINSGSSGFQGAPGAGGNLVAYSLSNAAADADKAVIFWRNA